MRSKRTIREIKRDLRRYLFMHYVLNQVGAVEGQERYLRHIKAMERELELRRTGYVLTM